MDEPLSNLDAKLRGHMRSELKHMQHKLGITTIYVTHDQIEAMTLAHRVAILDKGTLQQLGSPAAIYNDPDNLFVAGFIGSPPMNLIPGGLHDGLFETNGARVPTLVRASLARSVLGVRPEDCRIMADGEGPISGTIYSTELVGDHALATVSVGGSTAAVKAPRDFTAEIGAKVGVAVEPRSVFVFDAASGARVR
jgi:multiple sugar transport system ATP-binding protein